jgi:hypothetical protein
MSTNNFLAELVIHNGTFLLPHGGDREQCKTTQNSLKLLFDIVGNWMLFASVLRVDVTHECVTVASQ